MMRVMKLNLYEDFDPVNGTTEIEYEKFFFSGGEPHIKIKERFFDPVNVIVTTRLKSMNDLGMLFVAVDALNRIGGVMGMQLVVPYFPGARQDRQMVSGEPLTVKIYADAINAMGFDLVTILDPHSDVTPAVLDNCRVMNNHWFVRRVLTNIEADYPLSAINLVSPDAGAQKKVYKLMEELSPHYSLDLILADKRRDVTNGKLLGAEVRTENLKGQPTLIVDDICDGGGTFMMLAEKLKEKNAGDLYLAVTHGIFSKGFKDLRKHFQGIYTTNSWASEYGWEVPEIEKGSEIVDIISWTI